MSGAGLNDAIQFDRFTFSRSQRRLFLDGNPVPVSAPALRLLLALLDNPSRVLTKQALIAQVWGTCFITENALHVQIAALRKAIGNHLIITQSGIGYRFVGRIGAPEPVPPERVPPEPVPPVSPPPRPAGTRTLIGRDAMLADMKRAFGQRRFITLTGPGGVGKTSLAATFIQDHGDGFPDGTCLVELAAVHDEAGLINAINASLRREGCFAERPLAELVEHLRPQRLLLVLDNCEHLLQSASRVAEALFSGAPDLAILATSRQALACHGEHVLAAPPLLVPDAGSHDAAELRNAPSCRLFNERIAALDPAYRAADAQMPIVSRICRRLDGLPLALEIVASWASLLGLETVEAKLSHSHIDWAYARMTAPARHHNLRNTLDWSYTLLVPQEATLLRRLAVFAQDFTLEAAEPVAACALLPAACVFTRLAGLIQKSLVVPVAGSRPPAYRLLETTRAFAREKLHEAGEEAAARAVHAQALLAGLVDAEREWDLLGGDPWLARHGHRIADVRGALEWALARRTDIATGIAVAAAAWPLWRELSLRVEGAPWFDLALRLLPDADVPAEVEAQLRFGLAMMHSDSNWHLARTAFEEAAALYRTLGDRHRLGRSLQHLAFTLFLLGDARGAETLSDEARDLLQASNSGRALAAVYVIQLVLLSERNDFAAADAAGRHAVRLYEAMGAERSALSARCNLLAIALRRDDVASAIADAQALAAHLRHTQHSGVLGVVLVNLLAGLVRTGDLDRALSVAQEAAPLLSNHRPLSVLIDHLALRCALLDRSIEAALLAGFADAACARNRQPRQHVELHAADQLRRLLERALTDRDLLRLLQEGALLTQAAAWSIATGTPGAGHATGISGAGHARAGAAPDAAASPRTAPAAAAYAGE